MRSRPRTGCASDSVVGCSPRSPGHRAPPVQRDRTAGHCIRYNGARLADERALALIALDDSASHMGRNVALAPGRTGMRLWPVRGSELLFLELRDQGVERTAQHLREIA